MFDFERDIAKRTNISTEQLVNSGPYLLFRSGLIERWNVLNEHHTYPKYDKTLNNKLMTDLISYILPTRYHLKFKDQNHFYRRWL